MFIDTFKLPVSQAYIQKLKQSSKDLKITDKISKFYPNIKYFIDLKGLS